MTLNQRGQAAIFVALMFNVLFVFFAMAINVSMVVHDKINLQNSVDLAAYYAAAKQAEMLNVIAHENYQIRQAWKLLAWRYRVLGTMGFIEGSPHPVQLDDKSDTNYSQSERPSVCMVYKPNWEEVPPNENLCNKPDLNIPALPEVKVIAGFLGLNHGIAALSRQLRLQFDTQCSFLAAVNWWYAASIMHSFRLDQRNRKAVMYALAKTMSEGQNGDFIDMDGNSVAEGARQTFIKNLTFANRQAFDAGGGEFQIFNSLEGVKPEQWLVEIKTVPTIYYTDVRAGTDACIAEVTPISSLPQRVDAVNTLKRAYPNGFGASDLFPWFQGDSFLQDSDFQYSIGVEKNPWFMPYMGIKVKTTPRQVFFPYGNGVELVARSFAKPFGGRIGPWYQARWERGGQNSEGLKTDLLMAPRMAAGGLLNGSNDPLRLPNYSRFPGDQLGLKSKLALNSLSGLKSLQMRHDYYINIKEDMGNGLPNDVLAWDGKNNSSPVIRFYEISALAPDLFDISYYSIEPGFTKNYFARLVANRSRLNIPASIPIRPDIGSHDPVIQNYSVQEQMALAKDKGWQRPESYWYVRSKTHLLTAWLPGDGPYNYDVNASLENFGKCAVPDDNLKFPNPGSCVAGGGRTGYSVKMINRDALLSGQHKIGGTAGANAIMNPPPADF